MAHTLLRTLDVTKTYGDFAALRRVSLTVAQGDIYGLVGRNGAGKTTLFKCVMGLARQSGGTITLDDSTDLDAARRHVGFMINPAFFPYLNAHDNLEYLRIAKGLRDASQVGRLLKLVGLDGVTKPFATYSLGMKQRLGIAGALLGSPSLVVLDEPINGLDPQGIIDMRAVITDIHAAHGTTFLISSHILSELDLVATRFGFIDEGVLLEEITHQDLHERTRRSLTLEVDDAARARGVLTNLGIRDVTTEGARLTLASHVDNSNAIAHALVTAGVQLYDLHRQETSLEDYFIGLVGGDRHAASAAR